MGQPQTTNREWLDGSRAWLDISTYARGMSLVDAILSSKFHAGVSRTFDWSNRWDTILPTDTDLNSPRA
jgi:hypothetical protein